MGNTSRPGVLITRPEPGLSATAEAVRDLGWEPVSAPALRISHAPSLRLPAPLSAFQAIFITSSQSIPGLLSLNSPHVPLFTVGDGTAQRAIAAGFTNVRSASGNAQDLFRMLSSELNPKNGPLLQLSGAHQGLPLAQELRRQGFRITRRVAYDASPLTTPPDEALRVLSGIQLRAVMVFSAAGADATAEMLKRHFRQDLHMLRSVAISVRAADILIRAGLRNVDTVPHPDMASMLTALGPAGSDA